MVSPSTPRCWPIARNKLINGATVKVNHDAACGLGTLVNIIRDAVTITVRHWFHLNHDIGRGIRASAGKQGADTRWREPLDSVVTGIRHQEISRAIKGQIRRGA